MDPRELETPILFYDGECGLCARSVRWSLAHDRRGRLRFSPLQGKTYAALERPGKPADLSSVVLWDRQGLHRESEAVLRLLGYAGAGWRLLGAAGRIVPRPLRDAAYRFVAKHRMELGPAGACGLPEPARSERFLP